MEKHTTSHQPIDSFEHTGISQTLLRAVSAMGFEKPTPIQAACIPPIMEGRDVLAAAATGQGKTAGFLLPILHQLEKRPRGTTRALVLAPTREIAAQTAEHMAELVRYTDIRGAAVFGGVGMRPQVQAFERGVDVIVATPGRLLDHFQYDYAKVDELEMLVIDEADRMLDMGFLPDVKRVLEKLPRQRQTMLFSATMPKAIVDLSRNILRSAVHIGSERKAAPATGITHRVYPVADALKPDLLAEIVKNGAFDSVLAFTRTKHRANRLAKKLEERGIRCALIHGGKSQTRRTEAMSGFKTGRFNVMVATDIAARGIDVEGLALVVNVDIPNMAEDYIHRVGRTARADATGVAITLLAPAETQDFGRIERQLGKKISRERVTGFDYDQKADEPFEIPIGVRIAEIRKRKAEERARSKAKAERKVAAGVEQVRSKKRPAGEKHQPSGNDPARAQGARAQQGPPNGSQSFGAKRRRRRGGAALGAAAAQRSPSGSR